MSVLRRLDNFLNSMTMYRLLLYSLRIITAAGIIFSFTGVLSLSFSAMLISLTIVVCVCYICNRLLSRSWQITAATDSWLITALILFCIMPPATTLNRIAALILASIIAMASKYVLAIDRKHFFNPAAIAAVSVGFLGLAHATWWVGSTVMLPFTAILGLLIVRKVRRHKMFLSYLGTSLAVLLFIAMRRGLDPVDFIIPAFASGPLIFLGTVMLTEPSTLPPRTKYQMIYGSLVGGLFASQMHFGSLYLTPEIALVIGNVFSYVVGAKYKVELTLKEKRRLSERVIDFNFDTDRRLRYTPGQYLEVILPHSHVDNRGNRRTFSIASSPTEDIVHLGIKFYDPSSSFKVALNAMRRGDSMFAGQFAGDFIMPKDPHRKLLFIAGGIGITPFRSMLKYLIDTREKRDIVLFYLLSSPEEVSYYPILRQAERIGLRTIKILAGDTKPKNWDGKVGFLTKEIINQDVPDYTERSFYISGPNAMVENYRVVARAMGVKSKAIVTDYFSGY